MIAILVFLVGLNRKLGLKELISKSYDDKECYIIQIRLFVYSQY